MPNTMDEKKRRRLVALTRELKKQKGLTIKKSELDTEIKNLKKTQDEITQLAATNNAREVQDAARESHIKLQNVIDDINLYMGLIYPEGLLEIDAEGTGLAVSISG